MKAPPPPPRRLGTISVDKDPKRPWNSAFFYIFLHIPPPPPLGRPLSEQQLGVVSSTFWEFDIEGGGKGPATSFVTSSCYAQGSGATPEMIFFICT